MTREVLDEYLLVDLARLGRADRIELELRARDPELAPQPCRNRDELRVDLGLRETEGFDAHLMELPIAAFLRFLTPKHRAREPELLLLVVQQAVRQGGAHGAGGTFGPQ